MIPETQKPTNDLIDFMTDACQTIEEIELQDGTTQKQLVLNPHKVWLKTHNVNSPTFGRYTFIRELLGNLAMQCDDFMCLKRAKVLAKHINEYGDALDFSIDAKSSECLRDKNNTQNTLVDKLGHTKVEKQYTIRGDAKKTFMQGVFGRDEEKDNY